MWVRRGIYPTELAEPLSGLENPDVDDDLDMERFRTLPYAGISGNVLATRI